MKDCENIELWFMISQSFFIYVERCQIDAEELSKQRIVEVSILKKIQKSNIKSCYSIQGGS